MSVRLRDERGSALVIAVMVIFVMMGIGLATASYGDGQQAQSGRERIRESAFNLAESALGAQVFQLSENWPTGTAPYPTGCDPTSGATPGCPDDGSLQASATTSDFSSTPCPRGTVTPAWTTTVHDDAGAEVYYDRQIVDLQPTYDANGNGRLWVRASGTARCNQRTVVTMVAQGETVLNFPRNAVTANWFQTTNNGNKVIIDTQGDSAQPAPVVVRCAAPKTSPSCKAYSRAVQVGPGPVEESPPGSPDPALPPADLAALKARAVSLGTYYAAGTCPPSLTGAAVYVEDFTGCSTGGDGNSAAVPGSLYIARGTLSLGGNARFYGIVYMGNLQNSSGIVVSLGGNARITGAVVIDGLGGLSAGSSKANVVFAGGVFDFFKGSGAAAVVPNTSRELPGGQ